MTRTLVMLHERRGTTFLMSLLFGKPGEFAHTDKSFGKINSPMWLNTTPKRKVKFYYHGDPTVNTLRDLIYARPNVKTDEMYTWVPPANLHSSFYDNLPNPENWRFIYLMRDPRNNISSLCRRSQLKGKALDSMFETQCGYFAYELPGVAQQMKDKRFHVLFFEDFIADPLKHITKVFNFIGHKIPRKQYQKIIKDYQSSYINTSFQDNGKDSNNRWSNWSQDWKDHYKKIVGPGLEDLGYNRYLEW